MEPLQLETGLDGPKKQPVVAVTQQHKRVPRWLRMALRIGVLSCLVALPALALKEPSFERLLKYKNFAIVFIVLGTMVLPLWEPFVGNIVLAFTLIIPISYIGLWAAYGLFVGYSDIIFMMAACVIFTFIVFFTAELLSMPVGLLSVCATIFVAAANSYVSSPQMALMVAVLLTVLQALSAVIAVVVCCLIFPEYCVDEVFRHHHEGLEHLLHLSHHAFSSRPPPLIRRVATSTAASFGRGSKWASIFRAADELPTRPGAPGLELSGPSLSTVSGAESGGGDALAAAARALASVGAGEEAQAVQLASWQKVERSWFRAGMSFVAGGKAQAGAKAEVVIAAMGHKRIVVPCTPLLPLARGQMDEAALLALRHVSVAVALHMSKLFHATHPLDEATGALMQQLLSSSQWCSMRNSLLAALQELVSTFPMDYYPPPAAPDRSHLDAFTRAVTALHRAWKGSALTYDSTAAQQQQQQQQQQQVAQQQGGDAVLAPAAAAAAAAAPSAAADVFQAPLLPHDSPAAAALARMHVLLIVRLLEELDSLLLQLYDAAQDAASSIIRCKCGC